MATPRDIRRVALLALFQIDALGHSPSDDEIGSIRGALDDLDSLADEGFQMPEPTLAGKDLDHAMNKAISAWTHRHEADAETLRLAPDWPASRQAAVDRAILRLAHRELREAKSPAKAVISESVELAKAYSTEKSPGFINALLDRLYRDMTTPNRE